MSEMHRVLRPCGRVLCRTSIGPPCLGTRPIVPLLEQYVAEQGGLCREDAKTWADEQRELGARGEFFFTVTQFCFTASRPT